MKWYGLVKSEFNGGRIFWNGVMDGNMAKP
jgi:hypothetical protein